MSAFPPPTDPTPSTPGVPAGWYPDASTGRTRWWNGAEWTNDFAPPPAATVAYAPVGYGQMMYAPGGYPHPAPAGNGIAVAGFVLGLVGLLSRLVLYFLTGGGMADVLSLIIFGTPTILAIIFGAVGIARARRVGRGMPFAIIGLAFGVLGVLVSILALWRF